MGLKDQEVVSELSIFVGQWTTVVRSMLLNWNLLSDKDNEDDNNYDGKDTHDKDKHTKDNKNTKKNKKTKNFIVCV